MVEYVYIIQRVNLLDTNIYKIGRTKQKCLKRVCNYPKGSELVLQVECKDCEKIERDVIKLFRSKYIFRPDIGNEYFEGEKKSMMIDMFDIVMNEGKEEEIGTEGYLPESPQSIAVKNWLVNQTAFIITKNNKDKVSTREVLKQYHDDTEDINMKQKNL